LLGRGVSVGVVDVGWAQRQYARTADWVGERFAVLGDLNARYGTVDSRAAGSAASLPMARGSYVSANSDTPPRGDDYTPTGGGGLRSAAEVIAPHASEGVGDAGSHGGDAGPTLQRKSKEPEQALASPASPEKSAPLVSNISPTESAATPTLMRLASESQSPTTSSDVSAAELTLETPRADAPAGSSGDAPSVSAPSGSNTLPTAREVVPPVSAKQETSIQPTFAHVRGRAEETASTAMTSAETETSPEQHSLPLAKEEGPRASSESTATIMRASRGAESATPIQRVTESAAPIQRVEVGEEDAATSSAVETTLASSGPTGTQSAEHSTAAHATERVTAHEAESPKQTRLSAPEILQSPSLPLAARMVLRKSVGVGAVTSGVPDAARAAMPYVTPSPPSQSVANTQTLYRAAASEPLLARAASEGEGGAAVAPIAPAQSGAGVLSLEQITEHVSRVLFRRIAVERERRGARRWL
jgi:hypothetical protein